MQVRVTENRILIEPMENKELSDGGIYVGMPTTTFVQGSDKAKQITHGKVVAVGPGKRHPRTGIRLPMGVEVGQYVAFSDTCHRPSGMGDDTIVIKDDDVMLVSDEPIEHCELVYN